MKTLIVYNSRYGATEKCVQLLKEKIKVPVDIIKLEEETVLTLEYYDTILIGSSIYAGKMRPNIVKFVRQNESQLKMKNFGVILCCRDKGQDALKYIDENLPSWVGEKAFIKEALGHEIHLEKMNLFIRLLMKKLFKVNESYSKIDNEQISKVAEVINNL